MHKKSIEINAGGHIPPDALGKSLTLHYDDEMPDQVQLTITNQVGEKQSLIVLWGDLNGAIASMGHDPAQG